MNNSKTATQKHMTLDDRISIEKGLDQHLSLRSIALQLGKNPTTISKEIKKHRSFQEHNRFNEPANKCALAKDCKKKNICGTYAPVCKRMCRSCNHCLQTAMVRSRNKVLDLTIAVCWIKPLLSAMVAVKRIPAASIKPTTAHPLHTGNIKPSLWNQEQVLTFRLLTLLLWMNW